MTQRSFQRLWEALGAQGDSTPCHDELIQCYQEAHRAYHTLEHLQACLSLLSEVAHLADDPDALEAAFWFHDAIYDTTAHDNEAKSALMARQRLAQAGVAPERVARIEHLILTTQHQAEPEDGDPALMVDIDLSILGAEPERFDRYEEQIRAEYHWVPEPAFRSGRLAILESFILRSPIFRTPGLRDRFEDQARENLARSIKNLKHPPSSK